MKKQIASILAAAAFALTLAPMTISAEGVGSVTVTIANAGSLAVAAETMPLADLDGDGAMTINDVLIAAHDAHFEGGAAAGLVTVQTDYGLSITKLWGVENGGSYGYTLNDSLAMGLTDPVQSGDSICAYVYKDAAGFTDQYAFFDVKDAGEKEAGSTLELTLMTLGFDENWAPVSVPAEGAAITVNGVRTGDVTDAEGRVTLTLSAVGETVISAESDTAILVPPVCRVAVKEGEKTPETTEETTASATKSAEIDAAPPAAGDSALPAVCVGLLVTLGAAFALRRRED